MCSRVWFVTDRRISQEYPQVQILRALKERCADEDVEFRSLLMDQIVLTISDGQLGKYRPVDRSGLVCVWCKCNSLGSTGLRAVRRVGGGHCLETSPRASRGSAC